MRKGVFDPRAGIVDASRPGLPLQCYPKSRRLSQRSDRDLTAASGGRVKGQEIMSAVESMAKKYDYAATKPIANIGPLGPISRRQVGTLGSRQTAKWSI